MDDGPRTARVGDIGALSRLLESAPLGRRYGGEVVGMGARAFYRSAGYSEAELRRGAVRDRLAYPSVLMRRELAGG